MRLVPMAPAAATVGSDGALSAEAAVLDQPAGEPQPIVVGRLAELAAVVPDLQGDEPLGLQRREAAEAQAVRRGGRTDGPELGHRGSPAHGTRAMQDQV
jgi:hypothetical protein